MTFTVETYYNRQVYYHPVPDAIDFDDAEYVIQSQYPDQQVLAIIQHVKDTECTRKEHCQTDTKETSKQT
jgi:hypothetical protein